MVCRSRINETAMIDADQIEKALLDHGYTISRKTDLEITGTTHNGGYKILTFKRQKAGEKFVATWGAEGEVQQIGKRYAALTVQKFAKTRGFTVLNQKANQYVLVRR